MTEYIELEALKDKAFGKNHPTFYDGDDRADWYEKCIKDARAEDVAPVVRCESCIHYDMGVCLKIYDDGEASSYAWQERKPDDFCSYGKRRC